MLMGRMLKNILIRDLTDQDNETLRAIMKETSCFQASKAIMRAAYSFLRMSVLAKQQGERIKELEAENHVLRRNATQIVEYSKILDLVLSKTRK